MTRTQQANLESVLAVLRCPVDHGPLLLTPEGLANARLGTVYPLVEGIPDLRIRAERKDA